MIKDKVVSAAMGVFLIRLGLGLVFVVNGWGKLQGMEGVIAFFATLGFLPFFAYLVAYGEFLGGIAMITGVWTKWAGMLLAIIMAVAVWETKTDVGFTSYQLPLSLLFTSIGIAFTGPGSFTIHKLFSGK